MIQVLGVILVTGGASWLGFRAAKRIDRQWEDLRATIESMNILAQELEWDSPPLPELLERLVHRCSGPMKEFAQRLCQALDHLGEMTLLENWSLLVEKEQGFTPDVREALLPLGSTLGRYSCMEQRQAIERTRLRLEEIERELLEQRRQKGKLYRILGVSGGSFLALLLL